MLRFALRGRRFLQGGPRPGDFRTCAAAMTRLDKLLVDRGLFATRSRARDAILRGTVRVNGRRAEKPGQVEAPDCALAVDDPASGYVSRAALKLVAALDHFSFDPAGRLALDIGASTGGFTQVLLERGASRVFALDVGHGQLDAALAGDSRVTVLEKLNARELVLQHLQGLRPQFLVSDVSFISLRLALPPALEIAVPGAGGIFLVKPQFEAGREAIGKGGILRDEGVAEQVLDDLVGWLETCHDWRVVGHLPSPIAGGDGNREFLLAAEKSH